MAISDTSPIPSLSEETRFWRKVNGRWRQVYGGMEEQGFSLEFHDFAISEPLQWDESFHDLSLEICFNLHGEATLRRGAQTLELKDNEIAIYTVPATRPRAIRKPVARHCFYTLEFSVRWLRENLRQSLDHLKPEIRQFISRPNRARAHVERFTLPPSMIPMRIDLLAPPVPEAACSAWYYGKVFEILALTLYRQPEAFSASEGRNRERAERARVLIEKNFDNPPSLAELAEEAQCSPFHLSRTFKQELGISITHYQRAIRMEKAALFLRQGKSVTETAMAVGYSNVSAFIKGFDQHHCTTPARWIALWQNGN